VLGRSARWLRCLGTGRFPDKIKSRAGARSRPSGNLFRNSACPTRPVLVSRTRSGDDRPAPSGSAGLLAPVPLSGVLAGYGRVCTREQNLARQQARLAGAGCAKCFFGKATGKNTGRPELGKMLEYIRPGDALVVVSLDRLGRSLEDLIRVVGDRKYQQAGFRSLDENLDTTTAGGMFAFRVFALARFIRTIIVASTNEGLAAARAAGHRLGGPPAFRPEKVA
jgi:Resolvase, N terminal domain